MSRVGFVCHPRHAIYNDERENFTKRKDIHLSIQPFVSTEILQMCHLLGDQSQEVQRMGYHLLHNAAQKRTEHYVIEAGVDTEDVVKPELPLELLAVLQRSLGSGEVPGLDEQSIPRNKEVSGCLLAWMITFDLFTDAVRICAR